MTAIRAAIVGGTGYTGVELIRLLCSHPRVDLVAITSRNEAGRRVDEVFPSLRRRTDLSFTDPSKVPLPQCDIVFFATPNGVAMEQAKSLLDAGARVVDLSADFRLRDSASWQKWYRVSHASPELLQTAVYGLPEVNRQKIRDATLVANPGCYPTAVVLGLLPVIEAGAVEFDFLIANAASGVSGAGRKAELHTLYAEAADSFKAYGVSGHRHLPEITQCLQDVAKQPINLTFVPHLVPMVRGIHATLYAHPKSDIDVQEMYEARYAKEPFVDVMPSGSTPDTRSVRSANVCRIAVYRPNPATIVVLSVIDNLVKGAAGQAVQNMNLMFGLKETEGLETSPVFP